ncbi:MAG: CBS domain-containing protein [Zetaproteobacteria bacterium]|nr:CBS domain-containing protein [Zetaproteobacteria bacterium]
MKAFTIMETGSLTCKPDQKLSHLMGVLDQADYRLIPVVDDDGKLLGIIDVVLLLNKSVPEYVSNDSLGALHFAPDMGVMHKEFNKLMLMRAADVMDSEPAVVQEEESLLSVASTLLHHLREDHFEPVLVVDREHRYKGVISSGTILRALYENRDGGEC